MQNIRPSVLVQQLVATWQLLEILDEGDIVPRIHRTNRANSLEKELLSRLPNECLAHSLLSQLRNQAKLDTKDWEQTAAKIVDMATAELQPA